MRSLEAYLLDMVEAADRLASYISGMTRSEFLTDNLRQAGTVREIEIIGEASRKVPEAFRLLHPEVPWDTLARVRNLYIHVYHRIDYEHVWKTAIRTIPQVANAVRKLLPKPDEADARES